MVLVIVVWCGVDAGVIEGNGEESVFKNKGAISEFGSASSGVILWH